MRTATVKELKDELELKSQPELVELSLNLAKFKKENKELLTYLLYSSSDEEGFIHGVKTSMEEEFKMINRNSYYFIKKSVRKILRMAKKYIRYSKKKETEVEILLHFCKLLFEMEPNYAGNIALSNLFDRQLTALRKAVSNLHEDLQYDHHQAIKTMLDK